MQCLAAPDVALERVPTDRQMRLEDRQFNLMKAEYAEVGGLLDADDVVRLLRPRVAHPLSAVARWIVGRRIVNFLHAGRSWIPAFQFDRRSMQLRDDVVRIVDELAPALDDWDLALWFASPNEFLDGATPARDLSDRPAAVLQAARADRYIIRG